MEKTRKYNSRKRDAILRCLSSTDRHPTAEWIYQQVKPAFPDLSLATVYRNLAQAKQTGEICSIGVVNGLERFDYCTQPHAHFICCRCQAVLDAPNICVPASISQQASALLGAQIDALQVTFSGLCARCAGQSNPKSSQIK